MSWDRFGSDVYYENNYARVRSHNRRILEFLCVEAEGALRGRVRIVDIGTGANLYPALALAPYIGSIDFVDPSRNNRDWLEGQLGGSGSYWKHFWAECQRINPDRYGAFEDGWQSIRSRASIRDFRLSSIQSDAYDVALMFFVAESVTDDIAEFRENMRRCIECVAPGGWVFAGFMLGSAGYMVDGVRYPAISINGSELRECFAESCEEVRIEIIPRSTDAVRSGYSGMAVARARRGNPEGQPV